jgi:hypothetical protein
MAVFDTLSEIERLTMCALCPYGQIDTLKNILGALEDNSISLPDSKRGYVIRMLLALSCGLKEELSDMSKAADKLYDMDRANTKDEGSK